MRNNEEGADTRFPKSRSWKTPILGLASTRLHSDLIRVYVRQSFEMDVREIRLSRLSNI